MASKSRRTQAQRRPRDDEGRFASGNEDDRHSYRSRGQNYEDEGERYQREDHGYQRENRDEPEGNGNGHRRSSRPDSNRGHGGWFGDHEGHAEASHRGWEREDHGPSGWYGDREGHSEASRRGWEREDHGPSGWHGDREGHSEASQRGWEQGHRGGRYGSDRGEDEYRSHRYR